MTKLSPAQAGRYRLVCVQCGWETREDRHEIHCPHCGPSAFLQTRYDQQTLELAGNPEDFFSYRDWLPFDGSLDIPMTLRCIRADELGRELGLNDLWLLLCGYFPRQEACLTSCTFKMLEATGVMMRVLERSGKTLILSSAGNAGVAALEMGARAQIPAVVVVPESARNQMMTCPCTTEHGPMLILLKDSAYPDAIALVGRLQEHFKDRLVREGGAWNVARRDAMGVPVLRAAQAMGGIPDHYFQAVGSGTGGIAAFEAAERLCRGGWSGGPMHLHLVQNTPFTPMVDAWKEGRREVRHMDRSDVLDRLSRTFSNVLANAAPPYGVAGGVFDVVTKSGGELLAATNEEARNGCELLKKIPGCDPFPEAGVAMAGLLQAVENGTVNKNDSIVVHLTGGGWKASVKDFDKKPYPVALSIHPDEFDLAVRQVETYLNRWKD